jgi:hypothetical protein
VPGVGGILRARRVVMKTETIGVDDIREHSRIAYSTFLVYTINNIVDTLVYWTVQALR